MRFVNGAPSTPAVEDRRASYSNYFVGADRSRWRERVPQYDRVIQRQVYPGIDVVYYGTSVGAHLEFDFVVAPGADPSRIAMRWENAGGVRVNQEGHLVVSTAAGDLVQHAPKVYQSREGQRTLVVATYVLGSGGAVAFSLSTYDRSRELVIDPVVTYSTYLGGAAADAAYAMAVDAAQNVYLCGITYSSDFPRLGSATRNLTEDVFVAKLNAEGTSLIFTTFLGGANMDYCTGMALDQSNNIYLVGWTFSSDFPRVNAFDNTLGGASDLIVTKLHSSGTALVYSTYLGGSGAEYVTTGLTAGINNTIAVDERGSAYVGTTTNSDDYPTTAGAFDTTYNGGGADAVITKLDPAGNTLAFSTYLGGSGEDDLNALSIDGAGNVYLCGQTVSPEFPITAGAVDSTLGSFDVFVSKLNATGSGLAYSTFLGGADGDFGYAIAVDAFGRAHIAGTTGGVAFPATSGAYDTTPNGGSDVFVAKLNSDGTALLFATLLGGSGSESAAGISVDVFGNVSVGGSTSSANFPLTGDALDNLVTGNEGFVALLDSTGSRLLYSTVYGGPGLDSVGAVATDQAGSVYFAGLTVEGGIPTVAGSFDATYNGDFDGFAGKIANFGFSACNPAPAAQNASAPAAGLQGNYGVVTAPACAWTALSGLPGALTMFAPSSGTGSGNVSYALAANPSANARFLSIATGDALHNIDQVGTANASVFADVSANHVFFVPILGLQQKGITLGCGGGNYCPADIVTRGQMAAFVMRAIAGGDTFAFPATQRFTDVPPTHQFFRHIQMLASLGITLGCEANAFCPDALVTRGQMAAFVMRALAGNRFRSPEAPIFEDVAGSDPFFRYVQALAQRGITSGVSNNPPRYGPEQPVTREQMAAFLMRAFSTK